MCGVVLLVVVGLILLASGAWPFALLALILAGLWQAFSAKTSAAPVINSPRFVNDSKRQHDTAAAQTWAGFLKETYRQKKNSGATVKLGSGFEIGIVGESFHVPELRWIRAQFADDQPARYRVRFRAYLIPEPDNPHSPNRDAVRVESPRGATIGHLSSQHAAEYAPVFKALHAAGRVGVCSAFTMGGTDRKPNIGVWIKIDHSAWLQESLNQAEQPAPAKLRRPRPKLRPDSDEAF